MAGIRHVRYLTDVEALQYRKYLLRPGGRSLGGCVGAGVHLHFQLASGKVILVAGL